MQALRALQQVLPLNTYPLLCCKPEVHCDRVVTAVSIATCMCVCVCVCVRARVRQLPIGPPQGCFFMFLPAAVLCLLVQYLYVCVCMCLCGGMPY